ELYDYRKPNISEHVFVNRIGTPYRTGNIDQKFRYLRTCVMSIYPDDDISGVTPHCFRHTFTTNGITAGITIKNMQSLLGHADTRTLLNTYMHVGYEDKNRLLKSLKTILLLRIK
ncbi:MAG: tyrosine-type recombinase/integrase, partial [Deferribacterales bacterium]|nr:tyrosine-type recombinase/integrase [Deferribacterales bacterium]